MTRNGGTKRSLSEAETPPPEALTSTPKTSTPSNKRVKAALETPSPSKGKGKVASPTKQSPTLAKKLAQLATYLQTPYPDYLRPTAAEAQSVHDLLSEVHGKPERPTTLVDKPNAAAGCGQVPSVLDALVRTILSQNTTSANSTRAKEAMDAKYGRGNYRAVLDGTVAELQATIIAGGLANIKGKAIHSILRSLDEREGGNGTLSLDYLHKYSDLEAMTELVSFDGVGPKTASCVLLFCLSRNSFAVDTHVFRISKMLRWVPSHATRETAFQHLDVLIPDELKYGLHSLLVRHGRGCEKCAANGVTSMDFVDRCPIDALVTRSLGGVKATKKPKGKKGKGKGKGKAKEEDEDEDAEMDASEEQDDYDAKPDIASPTPRRKFDFVVEVPPSTMRATRSRKIIQEELQDDKVVEELVAEVQSVAGPSGERKVARGGLMHGLEV
ncbi:hypothetical protein RQP46_000791 [Phenoliferia psychrophenolica]